jgi:hypothetical protein
MPGNDSRAMPLPACLCGKSWRSRLGASHWRIFQRDNEPVVVTKMPAKDFLNLSWTADLQRDRTFVSKGLGAADQLSGIEGRLLLQPQFRSVRLLRVQLLPDSLCSIPRERKKLSHAESIMRLPTMTDWVGRFCKDALALFFRTCLDACRFVRPRCGLLELVSSGP